MICSQCGHEFDDGLIFCPSCGAEVHIVPEFEPEIEQSIEESILNIVTEVIDEGETTEPDDGLNTSSDMFSDNGDEIIKKVTMSRFALLLVVGGALIITVLLIFIGVMFYRDNSSSYQCNKGNRAFDNGEYKTAIDYYKKAISIDPEDYELYYKTADCYIAMDNTEMAIDIYKSVIDRDPNATLAFSKIIDIYSESGDYDEIDSFLKEYGNDDIKAAFVDYLAYPPVFSYDDGSYDTTIILSISCDSKGSIYYTDDGSKPEITSTEYKEPLLLKKGKHFIQAIFVNSYGVVSPVMAHTYNILAEAPSAPMVSLDSGQYDTPQLIRVIVPEDCYVYYTLDGSEPDDNSRIYGEPIPISDGETTIKLVAVNSRGVKSDVVEKEYTINVEKMFDPDMGRNLLLTHLTSIGYITDISGTSPIYPGRFDYLYSDMRYVGNRSLYCYNEYYLFGSGARSMTGNIFAVDCMTGDVFLLKRSTNDTYSATPF